MATLREVRKKFRRFNPSQLEAFRRKLEHGQTYWTAEDYVSLYADRPDLRDRICAYLRLTTESPRRDWLGIIIGVVIGIAGLVLSLLK